VNLFPPRFRKVFAVKLPSLRTGIVLGVVLFMVGAVRADDPKKNAEPPADKAGPEHKKLDALAGSWTFTMKMWMEPGKPPQEGKGTAEQKWIMDGRFLQEDVHSDSFGDKFTGMGLTGYDNGIGKYTSFWIDSTTTAMSLSLGSADASGKVVTFNKDEFDPMTKKKVKIRDVIRIDSNDKHTVESYRTEEGGKEMKMMEIVYTRKK
jgi:hypothetical protein